MHNGAIQMCVFNCRMKIFTIHSIQLYCLLKYGNLLSGTSITQNIQLNVTINKHSISISIKHEAILTAHIRLVNSVNRSCMSTHTHTHTNVCTHTHTHTQTQAHAPIQEHTLQIVTGNCTIISYNPTHIHMDTLTCMHLINFYNQVLLDY